MAKITVIGSSNTDMVVVSDRIPAPGETIVGGRFVQAPGGKGANQAVAAARLGADVTLVACVGDDNLGKAALDGFKADGIDTSYIQTIKGEATGVALIMVDAKAENSIAVAPGANHALTPEMVLAAEDAIASSDIVLAQLEVPISAVVKAAELARKHNVRFILNPAPAAPLPAELFSLVTVMTPNETEAAQLAAIDSEDPEALSRALLKLGVKSVVMTLGSAGALVADGNEVKEVASFKVTPVDTTRAGDAFNGALAIGMAEGKSIPDAARFASAAAAIATTRLGAQPSMATRQEVEDILTK